MENKGQQKKWQWGREKDRSRRAEIRYQSNSDNPLVVRRKKRGQRQRKKIKKRWSVRPDVNMVGVPPGKQCHVISAVVMIFFSVFLALSGFIVLVIFKPLTTLFIAIGVSVLVVGLLIFTTGLTFLICVCCFRKSTRYKQYIAQFKDGEKCEITAAQPQQTVRAPVLTPNLPDTSLPMNSTANTRVQSSLASEGTVQTSIENESTLPSADVIKLQASQVSQHEETTPTMFVTANDQTPSSIRVTPGSKSEPTWTTSGGYQRLHMTQLTDYTLEMKTANDGDDIDIDDRDHSHLQEDLSTTVIDSTAQQHMANDLSRLEEDLLHRPLSSNSDEQELLHLMSQIQPVDVSTPVRQQLLTVPGGSVQEGGNIASTPPTPTPPSYDHVIKHYRTYSRSSSPVLDRESDV